MAERRDFLTLFKQPFDKKSKASTCVVRPPYCSDESALQNECPACETQACVTSCDEQIIIIDANRTPILNFTKSGCTFCEACAEACEKDGLGILSLSNTHTSEKINAEFTISTESCVAHHGVICFSCKEPCIDDAILFNGMFNPVIDMDKCTGCGFCMQKCPTKAINYRVVPIANREENEK